MKFNDVWNLIAIGSSSSIDSEEFLHKMKLSWTVDGQEKYIKYKVCLKIERTLCLIFNANEFAVESVRQRKLACLTYKLLTTGRPDRDWVRSSGRLRNRWIDQLR